MILIKKNILTIFDDLRINTKFYYYSNYYNYIINVKEIRDNIIKSKTVCKNGLEMTEKLNKEFENLMKNLIKVLKNLEVIMKKLFFEKLIIKRIK